MTAPFKNMTAAEAAGFMSTKENQIIRDVLVEIVGDEKVLDIGCGRGIGVDKLCPDPKNYFGIDCSPALVAQAKKDYPDYDFVCADIRSAPFANKAYDYAILKSVLEHQESLDDALLIYNFALRMANTVLVGWHTPPIYDQTKIITVNACDLSKPLYQNHYKKGSFDLEDVSVKVERVGDFTLWTAQSN